MKCPFCGHESTSVKDSRAIEDNTGIRRRRHCLECGARFSTVEHVQLLPLKVRKKGDRVEPFQREKIVQAMERALHKRPVDSERVERIINSIVRQLESLGETEIPSSTIGEMIMKTLSDLDEVAYVRFASIYRNFDAPDDFKKFIRDSIPLHKK